VNSMPLMFFEMDPRTGSSWQVAEDEYRVHIQVEVTGIQGDLMLVHFPGTKTEDVGWISQRMMEVIRVFSGRTTASRPIEEDTVGGWHMLKEDSMSDSWWFCLRGKLQRPQEKPL